MLPPLATVLVVEALLSLLTATALGLSLPSTATLPFGAVLLALHVYAALRGLRVVVRVATGVRRGVARAVVIARTVGAVVVSAALAGGAMVTVPGWMLRPTVWAAMTAVALCAAGYAYLTSPARRR